METNYLVTDIEYDTDGEEVDLPTTLEIPVPNDEENIEDFISDKISDLTGFCHFGFNFVKK